MAQLEQASRELFSRVPDWTFDSFEELSDFCAEQKRYSIERWEERGWGIPTLLKDDGQLGVTITSAQFRPKSSGKFQLNDWSFRQLCDLAGVDHATMNQLSAETAVQVFRDIWPNGLKPSFVLTTGGQIRATRPVFRKRIYNADLLAVVEKHAAGYVLPREGSNPEKSLYAGEQDMVAFFIDPTERIEIGDEVFAPGFCVWNSEVGRRTAGVGLFWSQVNAGYHIVGDDWTSKDITAWEINDLGDADSAVEAAVRFRNLQRDKFIRRIAESKSKVLGKDVDSTLKRLGQTGLDLEVVLSAIEMITDSESQITLFSIVQALARLARQVPNGSDRLEEELKISELFWRTSTSPKILNFPLG